MRWIIVTSWESGYWRVTAIGSPLKEYGQVGQTAKHHRRSEYQFNQLPDGGKMNESQYEVAKLQQEVDRMDVIGYELYCNLEIALDALNQIIDIPNVSATDARAVKDMVKAATWALKIIQDGEIAEHSS
jgi:hypothetical protein